MGHVYRSLAYASKIREAAPDSAVRFFMRDFPEGVVKVRQEGYEVSVLPRRPRRADFESAFRAHPPELVIIDSLGSSDDLIDAARESAHTVITLDDLEPSAARADAIVNGILWATRRLPEPFGSATVYQGVEYVQLREQFASANRKERVISPGVRRILISTGGADGRGFALQLMEAVRNLSFECAVAVMAGPAYRNTPHLKEAARSMSAGARFSIVENAPNMADYLVSADLALITGGNVMFESAACGTPAVIACSYEHQVPQAEWIHARRAARNLGFFREGVDCGRVAEAVEDLAADERRRRLMSEAAKAAVDGRGLERFVKIVRARLAGDSNA